MAQIWQKVCVVAPHRLPPSAGSVEAKIEKRTPAHLFTQSYSPTIPPRRYRGGLCMQRTGTAFVRRMLRHGSRSCFEEACPARSAWRTGSGVLFSVCSFRFSVAAIAAESRNGCRSHSLQRCGGGRCVSGRADAAEVRRCGGAAGLAKRRFRGVPRGHKGSSSSGSICDPRRWRDWLAP